MDLHALVDGRVSDERRRELEIRAASAPDIAERLAAFRHQNALFAEIRRSLGRMDSAAFEPSLQRSVADLLVQRRRQRRLFAGGAAAAAAAVALTAGAWGVWGDAIGPEKGRLADAPEFPFGGSLVLPAAAMPDGGGRESLAWLTQQMSGEALHLTDLEQMGLRLAGGGVLSGAKSPAVHLVFVDEKNRPISLYVGIVSRGVKAAFSQVPEGHVSMHWRQGRLIFALVGAVDSPHLLDLMTRVTAGINQAAGNNVAAQAPSSTLQKDMAAGPLQPAVLPAEPVARDRTPTAPAAVAPVIPAPTEVVAPTGKADAKAL